MKSEAFQFLKRVITLGLIAGVSGITVAATPSKKVAESARPTPVTATSIFRNFLDCDASFFVVLKTAPNVFGPQVSIVDRNVVAVPAVADPLAADGRQQLFRQPVTVDTLSLTTWHNEVMYEQEKDRTTGYLYWGFIAEGTPEEAAVKINKLLSEDKRVEKRGDIWVRAEIRSVGDPLTQFKKGAQPGTVPARGTVERVLLIEGSSEPSAPSTKVFCSLQGATSPILLKNLRPDLLDKELP